MRVEVCYATASDATRIIVELQDGATIDDAVGRSGIAGRLMLDLSGLTFAVFGRRATAATIVHDGDRVELLRPLVVDPKEARHRRASKRAGQRVAALTSERKDTGSPPSRG